MQKEEIIKILHNIENDENIEVLYACEAGSRVRGFSKVGSDYDIRFIYRKVDVQDYLSLKEINDVIEYSQENMDIVGWDIKKALNLHFKDNPNLREWLISPEVYIDKGIDEMFDGLGRFDVNVLKNHYLAIALVHWKKYNGLEFNSKKIKKYFFVIRSILSWNILDNGRYPPISIQELLDHECCGISDDVKDSIENLIECYLSDCEIREETIFIINNFILNSFNSMKKVKTKSDKNFNLYEKRFKELIKIR